MEESKRPKIIILACQLEGLIATMARLLDMASAEEVDIIVQEVQQANRRSFDTDRETIREMSQKIMAFGQEVRSAQAEITPRIKQNRKTGLNSARNRIIT